MKMKYSLLLLTFLLPLSQGLFLRHIVNGIRYKTSKILQFLDWVENHLHLDEEVLQNVTIEPIEIGTDEYVNTKPSIIENENVTSSRKSRKSVDDNITISSTSTVSTTGSVSESTTTTTTSTSRTTTIRRTARRTMRGQAKLGTKLCRTETIRTPFKRCKIDGDCDGEDCSKQCETYFRMARKVTCGQPI